MASDPDIARLEAAIAAFRNAIDAYPPPDSSRERICAQNNLSSALASLGRRNGSSDLLKEAADGFRRVLLEYTRERMPMDWAMAQSNLGAALEDLFSMQGGVPNLEEAAGAFSLALEEYTLERHPREHLQTAHGLGRTLLRMGDWGGVASSLSPLLKAAIPIVQSEPPGPRQALLLGHLTGVGDTLAYALARQGQLAEALAAAGRGRAILMAGICGFDSTLNRQQLIDSRKTLRERQVAAKRAEKVPLTGVSLAQLAARGRFRLEHHRAVRAAFDCFAALLAEAGIRSEPPPLAAAAAVLPPGGALAVPIVTAVGGAILIMRQRDGAVDVIWHDQMAMATVDSLLLDRSASEPDGWLVDLDQFRARIAEIRRVRQAGETDDRQAADATRAAIGMFNAAIVALQEKLGDLLMAELDRRLCELGPRSGAEIVLMAPGRLALLPLHAGRIGGANCGRVFIDDWIVSQVPSLSALVASRQRAAARDGISPSLLAITDPMGDLGIDRNPAWGAFEAGARHRELRGPAATVEAVSKALTEHSHFCYFGHGQDFPPALILAKREPLTAAMLRDLDLSASRLMFLGACDSGTVDWRQVPDEHIGFPGAALESGLPAVVASLWPVEARATSGLVGAFFRRHLGDHAAPAAALRDTVLAMRGTAGAAGPIMFEVPSGAAESHHPASQADYTQPFYWAAFTITGA